MNTQTCHEIFWGNIEIDAYLHVVVRHGDGLDDAVLGGLVGLVDEAEGGRQEEEVLHVAARPGVRVRRRQRQVLVGVDA